MDRRGALDKATSEIRKGIEAVLPAPSSVGTTQRDRHGAASGGLFRPEGESAVAARAVMHADGVECHANMPISL